MEKLLNFVRMRSAPVKLGIVVVPAIGLAVTMNYLSSTPPLFKDVNGDGIEDKIVQRKVLNGYGFLGTPMTSRSEEIFFGVERNGEIEYLSRREFERVRK